MEVDSVEEPDESQRSSQQVRDLIRGEVLKNMMREIKKSYQRSRSTRVKLLKQISLYFEQISLAVVKERAQAQLMAEFALMKEAIAEVTELIISLSIPERQIPDLYDTVYNLGAFVECITIAVYSYCSRTGILFGPCVKDFLNRLLIISGTNKDTWLYSVFLSPLVLHMMNAFADDKHKDFVEAWSLEVKNVMVQMGEAVYKCGDFFCQHYLVNVISGWAKWMPSHKAISVIGMVFRCVNEDIRRKLTITQDDPNENDLCVREFLNSLNSSAYGPKNVTPLQCMCVFVGNHRIPPPQNEFWVDFSAQSGRIHMFHEGPENSPIVSLTIRKDQVESVCVNWVTSDGKTPTLSSLTQNSGDNLDRVVFLHLVLNVSFHEITTDVPGLTKHKNPRSIYFAFENVSDTLMGDMIRQMDYIIHKCGTKSCERPKELRNFITARPNVSYGSSWCPDSQVFGLDSTKESKENERDERNARISSKGSQPLAALPSVEITHGSSYISYSASPVSRIYNETGDDLNESWATNYEDPLPPGLREKYRHLGNHSPFHKKAQDADDTSQSIQGTPMTISPVRPRSPLAPSNVLVTPDNRVPPSVNKLHTRTSTPIGYVPREGHKTVTSEMTKDRTKVIFSTPVARSPATSRSPRNPFQGTRTPLRTPQQTRTPLKIHKTPNQRRTPLKSPNHPTRTPLKTPTHGIKLRKNTPFVFINSEEDSQIVEDEIHKQNISFVPLDSEDSQVYGSKARENTPFVQGDQEETPRHQRNIGKNTPFVRVETSRHERKIRKGTPFVQQTMNRSSTSPRSPVEKVYDEGNLEDDMVDKMQDCNVTSEELFPSPTPQQRKKPFVSQCHSENELETVNSDENFPPGTPRPHEELDDMDCSALSMSPVFGFSKALETRNEVNSSPQLVPQMNSPVTRSPPELDTSASSTSTQRSTPAKRSPPVPQRRPAVRFPPAQLGKPAPRPSPDRKEKPFRKEKPVKRSPPVRKEKPVQGSPPVRKDKPASRSAPVRKEKSVPGTPPVRKEKPAPSLPPVHKVKPAPKSPHGRPKKSAPQSPPARKEITPRLPPVHQEALDQGSPPASQTTRPRNRFPCYENSHTEWRQQEETYRKDKHYDPYDLLSSSQMELYRKQLFPENKTYDKARWNKVLAKGLKRKKIVKRKAQRSKLNAPVEINSEDLEVFPKKPKANARFFGRKRWLLA